MQSCVLARMQVKAEYIWNRTVLTFKLQMYGESCLENVWITKFVLEGVGKHILMKASGRGVCV